jgi:hypothetical protein
MKNHHFQQGHVIQGFQGQRIKDMLSRHEMYSCKAWLYGWQLIETSNKKAGTLAWPAFIYFSDITV